MVAKKRVSQKKAGKNKQSVTGKKGVDTKEEASPQKDLLANLPADMSVDARKKLEDIQGKIKKFQEKVLGKFDEYVMGLALMPPSKVEDIEKFENRKLSDEEKKTVQDRINVMVLVDDADSRKMTKQELHKKLSAIISQMALDVDKNLVPDTVLLSELWESCFDAKYDLVQAIALSAPVYDKGMLSAVKLTEVHKSMVLKKFEKYIVAYVLAGSMVQGKATAQSDVDVFVVIDDTDVKKMTRAELKDKLRSIIITMGHEAGKMTGVENKINIQVYILTDFWESVKEANPVIFTFLRDGVPFYDRGIFMPWKQLLQMGRIKPSPEAIDMFMNTGEQMLDRVKIRLREIGIEDFFWATLTPSQAAIMLYGLPPPTPKETPDVLRDLFVVKEKILEEEYIDILDHILKVRKQVEHGTKKNVTGKEIDHMLEGSEKYLKRLKQLFSDIETIKEKQSVVEVYDSVVTIVRDILRFEGVESVKDEEINITFKEHIIDRGILPAKTARLLSDVVKAKKDYDKGKLTKAETNAAKRQGKELFRELLEHLQRRRGKELERTKIRVKYGEKYGEIILLDSHAYIVRDIDAQEKEINKAQIKPDGSLTKIDSCTMDEFEKALAKVHIPAKTFIKQPIFKDLETIFGTDVEILINQ